jgi:hypothetical protein
MPFVQLQAESEAELTGADLIAEAKRIARPCTLLKRSGTRAGFAGVWRGPGIVPAPPGPYRHWLTFSCRFLPRGTGPSAGCLSVYTDERDCVGGVAVHDPSKELVWADKADGSSCASAGQAGHVTRPSDTWGRKLCVGSTPGPDLVLALLRCFEPCRHVRSIRFGKYCHH